MAKLSKPLSGKTAKKPGAARLTAVLLLALFLWAWPLAGLSLALEGQLNINRATAEELATLPFTGPKRAQAIVDHRRQHGPFDAVEELLQVSDIGPSTFQAIKPYIKLVGPSTLHADDPQPDTNGRAISGPDQSYNVQARIVTRPGEVMLLPDQHYFDTLLSFIEQASQRIEMAMFLFKITDSPGNRPTTLMQALIAARRRGVAVRVVLEESGYDDKLNASNRKVARTLARHGIQVQFDSRDHTSHMKLVVIDDRFCFIGSHNLTHAALTFNHEFSVLIDNRPLAQELTRFIATLPSPETR